MYADETMVSYALPGWIWVPSGPVHHFWLLSWWSTSFWLATSDIFEPKRMPLFIDSCLLSLLKADWKLKMRFRDRLLLPEDGPP